MTYAQHDKFALRWRRTLIPVLLALVFVFAQSLSLQHDHEGDLKVQVDCELCLKLNYSDDVLVHEHKLPEYVTGHVYQPLPQHDAPVRYLLSANARAPPYTA